MKSTITFLRSTVLVLLLLSGIENSFIQAQPFAGGSGTPGDPYQVATDVQLDSVRHYPSSHFMQTADISLSAYRSGEGWWPIANFSGSYNGGGFAISDLSISRGSTNDIGLFSTLNGAAISNLTLSSPSVTGNIRAAALAGSASGAMVSGITITTPSITTVKSNAGGLIGSSANTTISDIRVTSTSVRAEGIAAGGLVGRHTSGTITRVRVSGAFTSVEAQEDAGGIVGDLNGGTLSESYVIEGTVTASEVQSGGLAGESRGTITNSYANTRVIGGTGFANSEAGGLVGQNTGSITNSYSASVVTGDQAAGLVGLNNAGTITNSYFNSDFTANGNGNGTGLTTAQMRQQASFTGFNFDTTWAMLSEVSFPELRAFANLDPATLFAGGSGTQGDPYRIATADQLNNARFFQAAHYRQTADISLSAYRSGEGWWPIANFSGSYNGGGFAISSLSISRGSTNDVGLFSTLNGAVISNLTLSGPSVTGNIRAAALAGSAIGATVSGITITTPSITTVRSNAGGLIGSSANTTISDIRVTSTRVRAEGITAGGLVGRHSGGTITRVRVSGAFTSVEAQEDAGGIVGDLNGGTLSESYVIEGTVTASEVQSGGLVGQSLGTITNSYANTRVIGGTGFANSEVGGLVGQNTGSITNSYSASVVTGNQAAGLVGLNNGGAITNSYFNSDFTANGNGNGTGLTTAQMRQQASFTGFDFTSTWYINEGSDFPKLQVFLDFATLFAGGWGTPDNPYQVATADHLNNVRLFSSRYYRQTADIDLNVPPYNSVSGWEPISLFTGVYDGGGFTIFDIKVANAAIEHAGLFGRLDSATVTNLTFQRRADIAILTGITNAGILAGLATNSMISRIRILGGRVMGDRSTNGSLAGATVSGSVTDIEILDTFLRASGFDDDTGGLIGNASGTTIRQVRVSNATIRTLSDAGGVVGEFSSGGSLSESAVSGGNIEGDFAGGLVGKMTSGSIANSYATSPINGFNTVGGLVARLSGGGSITSSYATSVVTGNDTAGLVSNNSGGTITNSYFNSDSTANGNGNGTPLTTAQMQQRSSFTGFNFDTAWVMLNEGGAFPELRAFANLDPATLFAGGSGTQGDPYQVATADQLNNARFFQAAHYRQTADISLSAYQGGEGWRPIANFSGFYDGGGFAISNLRISRGSTKDVGLFSILNGAVISNLTLSGPRVTANRGAAALAGFASGATVRNLTVSSGVIESSSEGLGGLIAHSTGSVLSDIRVTGTTVSMTGSSGTTGLIMGTMIDGSLTRARVTGGVAWPRSSGGLGEKTGGLVGFVQGGSISESIAVGVTLDADSGGDGDRTGGLVGDLYEGGSISNSYARVRVIGPSNGFNNGFGGLVGILETSTITNSYSASVVTGSSAAGLAGISNSGAITNSYFNSDSTANGYGNGTPLTTVQMQQRSSFTGFNFDTTWVLLNPGGAFPELQAFVDVSSLFAGGSGTPDNPYQVATADQLNNVRLLFSRYYRQTADIDLNVPPYNDADGWEPIASFTGNFDGNGRTISNLFINRAGSDSVGLFGAATNATLAGITLTNASVTARNNVGVLLGTARGTTVISGIQISAGTVAGNFNAGGLVGAIYGNSSVSASRVMGGSATGTSSTGGLAGVMVENTSISTSQVTGSSVTGALNVGGLVGAAINNTAITRVGLTGGSVSGSTRGVGGLTGFSDGTISESFATGMSVTGTTSSVSEVGGLVGNAGGTITNSYTANRVHGENATVGGFSGRLRGGLGTSYSASVVTGGSSAGLVALREGPGSISNAFFNSDSTANGNGNGTPLTTAQMRQRSSFTGFDFTNTWIMFFEEGLFPGLQAFVDVNSLFAGGSGTQADPYQISRADQLHNVRLFPGAHFRQTADISLMAYQSGDGWLPIQDLTGSYDGGGYTISNLVINRAATDTVGLFAKVTGATLTKLTLSNPSVTGKNVVGALAGAVNSIPGTMSRIRIIKGSVNGDERLGGLVGVNEGVIRESGATGMRVSGAGYIIGGLVGISTGSGSSISNSYAVNRMSSSALGSFPGGLAGFSSSTAITNSYTASSGGWGVVSSNGGTITNSYYNSDSTANGNGTPLTTAQMRQQASFTGWDFLTRWFIDEGVSFPSLQERQSDELIITGDEGWRMLASPLSARSIGRLLTPLWTQGFPGADTTGGSPNLYFWNEASRTWTLPGDTSFTPGSGTGFLMYIYSDDNKDGSPEGFPKRISQTGSPFSGERSIDLSFTNTGDTTIDGWNLLGNPYPTSINWNAGEGWTRNNMDQTFYVWSDAASNGNGAYVTWNTMGIGSKGDGKIAPWQGFWVKANAPGPRITFSDLVRNSGGVLLKQAGPQIPQLQLELEGKGLSSKSVVMFHEQAEAGKDPLDAYKLNSLNKDYLLLGTSVDGQQAMDIQALPFSSGQTELELVMEGSDLDGEFTLNWSPEHLPQDWTAGLLDTETGKYFPLSEAGSYTFSLNRAKAKTEEKRKDIGRPASPITPVVKSKSGPVRFVIRFHLSVANESDPTLPQRVELQQNYPNPFNPGTTINYQVPEQSRVRLEVFDMLGRKVATLLNERVEAGYHQVRFDARNLASGMYIYRLQAGNTIITKKLTLIK